jgi:hypothetical protein
MRFLFHARQGATLPAEPLATASALWSDAPVLTTATMTCARRCRHWEGRKRTVRASPSLATTVCVAVSLHPLPVMPPTCVIGFHCSHERCPPSTLLGVAALAAEAGFTVRCAPITFIRGAHDRALAICVELDSQLLRRRPNGTFKESDQVGPLLPADRRQLAWTVSPRGRRDRGDR